MKDTNGENAVDSIDSGVNRRDFLKVGATAAAVAGASSVGMAESATAASYNPKKFAGSTVKILLVDGERDQNGIKDKISYIKKTHGITVEVTALALGAQLEKIQSVLHAPTSEYDIIDNLGFTVSGVVGGGLYTKLNDYIANKEVTASTYNYPADFPEGQLDYTSRYDVANNKFGGKDVYLIPGVHSGSVIMFYRKDLLSAAGIAVPKNWDDYIDAARRLNVGSVSGTSMIGGNDVSLILVDWYARFASMGGKLMSGTPGAKNYKPNLSSATAVRSVQHMIDCAEVSPKGVGSFGFTESVDAFSRGDVALMLCWSTIAGSAFNTATSKVASKIGAAQIPGDANTSGRPIRGGWGLGIPKNLPQKRKDAAWMVMQYITGATFDSYQFDNYQTDPNRRSTYANAALNKKYSYLKVAGQAMENAKMLDVALIPETFELVGEAAREFNLAIIGSQTAKQACANAQASWEKILKRAGHLA